MYPVPKTWLDALLRSDHTKVARIARVNPKGGADTSQLFCERHDIDVHIPGSICSHVLAGEPVERISYQYSRGCGVWVTAVACGLPRHSWPEDLFDACPQCLAELTAGHPKAMSREDREAWEASAAI